MNWGKGTFPSDLVEQLPNKHKALSSDPNTAKKKGRNLRESD
jgi:hypothetical protein